MKGLIDITKKHTLEKLKYISEVMNAVAKIVKDFAVIASSAGAAIVGSVTGYYEVKKVVKKNHHSKVLLNQKTSTESSNTTNAIQPDNQNETENYKFDTNSGALIISVIMLVVLVVKKLRKPKE